jgi:flagellar hook-basal body complex protein FliE
MEMKTNLATQLYAAAGQVAAPIPGTGDNSKTAEAALGRLANDFVATMREGEATAQAGMVGQADAHTVVEALAATELAVETAVTVRDKVVEAYQEILRMPV